MTRSNLWYKFSQKRAISTPAVYKKQRNICVAKCFSFFLFFLRGKGEGGQGRGGGVEGQPLL